MNCLSEINGSELVVLAAIFSIYLSQGLSADDIDTLGNFFTALGGNLTLIAGQMASDTTTTTSS